ncbi:hypothetical protein AB1207_24125 [Kineococcus endophyticus]|uniref:Centromere-binding protein ParB C-terminal domain-containing protein n=1 Tax=Kineococcus endophyticus TaxID=1181883 RepID=A0ABV3PDX3_9ACTN
MSAGKRVSATDMLSRGRRGASRPEPTNPPVDQATTQLVDQSSSELVEQPTTPVAPTAQTTYSKVAVSLTPQLRSWVKTTPVALGVEGLSSSDLVRLALTRLQADVKDGLPLTELLIEQAHAEAQELTGRRNRGLPTRR